MWKPDYLGSVKNLAEFPVHDFPESLWLWFAKITGAVFGSAISIAYMLPKGKREAAIRFAVGVLAGVIFGPLAGVELANRFELENELTRLELVLTGSATASLCAWWLLGVLHRFAMHYLPGKNISGK